MNEKAQVTSTAKPLDAESKPIIDAVARTSKDFLIVGLTGRNGSGLGELAEYLCGDLLMRTPIASRSPNCGGSSEHRDLVIAEKYLQRNWIPFVRVSATSAMLSFLFDLELNDWGKVKFRLSDEDEIDVFDCLERAYEPNGEDFAKCVTDRLLAVDRVIARQLGASQDPDRRDLIVKQAQGFLGGAGTLDALRESWREASAELADGKYENFDNIVICLGVLPTLAESFSAVLGDSTRFSLLFQRIGNNIRAYGKAYPVDDRSIDGDIFRFPKRVDQFCRAIRHYLWAGRGESAPAEGGNVPRSVPVFIVIDSFKNIFEAYYFKQKYAMFYLLAVSSDESQGQVRRTLRLDGSERDFVSLGEDLSTSKNAFKKYKDNYLEVDDDGVLVRRADADRGGTAALSGVSAMQHRYCENVFDFDELRKECYLGKIAPFVLQDVMTCIENADVFLTRDLSIPDIECDKRLLRSLARFITLAQHPGLLKPTKVERCMQMAMTAKLNSGCLSRQVGAVVADEEYQILSLGWNDVPCGSESCARRSLFDVASYTDRAAYSDFELADPTFRSYINSVYSRLVAGDAEGVLDGLPAAYCFKDAYQDIIGERDQIHTRSLHGEERALASCGNAGAKDAFLFTTSSPCELCAKKAKEAQIAKIYYIERYPGISHDHVIDDGPSGKRPRYEFFTGVVGAAYTKLYTPLIPYKDELEAIGISPKALAREGGWQGA